jgi:hypothetical protein
VTRPPLIGAACALALLATAPAATAQPAAYLKGAKTWQESTTGISGIWKMQGYIGSTHPVRERVARTVDGQLPPMQPWAAKLLEQRLVDAEHDKIFANTASLCQPEGVPYILFSAVSGPIQILETPGQVTLISEEMNEIWFIHLNEKHTEDVEPSFHGESVGHWEGDTLVIDTVGLSDRTTLDQVGMPHTNALHVITRVHRVDPNTLEFLVTIDDPKTFTHPWNRRVIYKKAAPTERIAEDVCENQRNGVDANGFQSFEIPKN